MIKPRTVGVREFEAPEPGPGEVAVRTLYSGISAGTELTTYRGTNPYLEKHWDAEAALFLPGQATFSYPIDVWGYSEVGEIAALGADTTGLEVGELVWGMWCHRSSAVLPAERLVGHRLPESVDPVVGTFARVGAVALNAVLAAGACIGETAVVFGQGVIGLLATQLLVGQGVEVVAIDMVPYRLELAGKFGATPLSAATGDLGVAVRDLTAGRGADRVIELTGAYPALHQAIRIAGVDGTVVAAGFYQGPATALVLGEEFHHNRVTLVSSQIGSLPPALRGRWSRERLHETVIRLCAGGRLDPLPLVTHLIPARRAAEAYELIDKPPADLLQVILDFRPPKNHERAIMNQTVRLAVQEQYLRGESMIEKWHHAQTLGFDAIELRGAGEGRFAARLPELREAAAAGVPMPTVCVEMLHFVGDFDAAKRRDAIEQMKAQLSVMAEIGGRLAMTPASYGMFSTRLPPFVSPRSIADDHAVLIEGFGELAAHAEQVEVVIALEPLNRYENHMINTLAQAAALCAEIGSPWFGIAADTYHMNIEEADPIKALFESAEWIRHIQLSDSNRLEPTAGHIDWSMMLAAIAAIDYADELAYECRLSGELDDVLPVSVRRIRQLAWS